MSAIALCANPFSLCVRARCFVTSYDFPISPLPSRSYRSNISLGSPHTLPNASSTLSCSFYSYYLLIFIMWNCEETRSASHTPMCRCCRRRWTLCACMLRMRARTSSHLCPIARIAIVIAVAAPLSPSIILYVCVCMRACHERYCEWCFLFCSDVRFGRLMLRYVLVKFSGSSLVLDETSRGARYFCDTRTNSPKI